FSYGSSVVYTQSLHDALPILLPLADEVDELEIDHHGAVLLAKFDCLLGVHSACLLVCRMRVARAPRNRANARATSPTAPPGGGRDRKSTRLNSSHVKNSYAVF